MNQNNLNKNLGLFDVFCIAGDFSFEHVWKKAKDKDRLTCFYSLSVKEYVTFRTLLNYKNLVRQHSQNRNP